MDKSKWKYGERGKMENNENNENTERKSGYIQDVKKQIK